MANEFAISVLVGAALGKTVPQTFSKLEDRTKTARKSLSQLILGKKAAADVLKYSKTLVTLKQKQAALGRESPRLSAGIAVLTQKYEKAKQSARGYGISIKDVGRAHDHLGRQIGQAERQLAKLQKRQARRNILSEGRAKLAGAKEIIDIEYALNSADLEADASRVGARIVSKVATVTNGAPEQVGEVIATTFNNLGDSLQGNVEERLSRIADLLTKTQFKFQIRNFDQLGQSLKLASPTLSQYNVNLDQGLTLLGALNSAGLQGTTAGTALTATFRNLSKASKQLGFELVRDEKGAFDFIATMENMRGAIGGFEDMDQDTIDQLQKLFGDEGIRGVSLLGKKLDDLAAAQKDVASTSRGIVDSNYQKFVEDSAGQWGRLTNNVSALGTSLATALMPILVPVIEGLADASGWIGNLIDDAPLLGTTIGGLAVGFGLYRSAVFAAALITGNYGKALDIVTLKSVPRALSRLKALAAQSLLTGQALSGGGAGGLLKSLAGRAGLLGIAAATGGAIGTAIWKKKLEGTDAGDAIGHTVATLLAGLGVQSAKDALAANERAFQAQGARLNENVVPFKGAGAPVAGTVPRKAGTTVTQDNRSEVHINIDGATDPAAVGAEVRNQLAAAEAEKAAQARASLHDLPRAS